MGSDEEIQAVIEIQIADRVYSRTVLDFKTPSDVEALKRAIEIWVDQLEGR